MLREPLEIQAETKIEDVKIVLSPHVATLTIRVRSVVGEPVDDVALTLVSSDPARWERKEAQLLEFKKAVDLSGRGSYAVTSLAAAYASSGKRAEARALLEELKEKYARREANGTDLAIIYAALGDNDRAIVSLEKDFETGNTVFLAMCKILTASTSHCATIRVTRIFCGGWDWRCNRMLSGSAFRREPKIAEGKAFSRVAPENGFACLTCKVA